MERNTFEEIKNIVFARKEGQCRSAAEWKQLYNEGAKDLPVDHLTSCPQCLDTVNNLLGLPSLSERHPFDTISRDSGNDNPSDPTASGGNSSRSSRNSKSDQNAIFQKLEKARVEQFAHQPEEITLCINGWPLTSRRVQSGVNVLTVRPQMEEPLDNLELLDENGKLICYLSVGDQCSAGSNGRWLNLSPSPNQRVDMAVTWLEDFPEIHLEYSDLRLKAAAPLPEKEGFLQRLQSWLSISSPTPARGLATAALALLVLLAIPIGLLYMEFSRSRQSIAALESELETTRKERDSLALRFADEQALRRAAEEERDRLKQQSTNLPKTEATPQPEQLAEASLLLRLRPGTDDMEAYQLGATRGDPFIKTIELPRQKEARFALNVMRKDEESQTSFDSYLVRISIPGRPPVVAHLKSPPAPADAVHVILQAVVANADRLAPDTKGEVLVYGISQKHQMELGRLPLRVK